MAYSVEDRFGANVTIKFSIIDDNSVMDLNFYLQTNAKTKSKTFYS
jgi:hypothetical protein